MSRGIRAVAVALQLIVVLFVGVLGTVLPHQDASLRIAAQLIALPVLLAGAALAMRRRPTPLDVPLVLALILYAVVSVASSDPTGSLQTAGMAAGWALLFVVMVEVGRHPWLRSPVALAVGMTITAWLAILAVTWIIEKVTWVRLGGGVPNVFESTQSIVWLTVNVIPVLALLGAPFLAYLPPGRPATILRVAFAIAAALTIPMSGGRAAWVGLVAAAIALVTLGGLGSLRRLSPRVALPLAAGFIGASATAVVLFGDRLFTLAGLSARWPLWSQAIGIATADPLTGGGPSTFSWLRLTHADDYATRVPAILAHDVPLQTLADGGALLGLALLLLVGGVAWVAWRLRRSLSAGGRWAVAALVGLAVTSLLDDHSSLPAVSAMAVTLAAWVVAEMPADRPSRVPAWLLPSVAAVLLLVAVPFAARVDFARLEAESGRASALDGDLGAATFRFEAASQLYPENALYRLEAGIVMALAGDTTEAASQFRAAAQLSSGDPRPLGALADLATSPEERVDLLHRAARLTGDDPRYSYRLGLALLEQDAAGWQAALARAVTIDSTILARLEDEVGSEMAGEVISHVPAVGSELAARLRLDVALLNDDLALYADAEPASSAHRAVAAQLDGRLDTANELLAEVASERPYAAQTWDAAAYVARQACEASAYRNAMLLRFWSPGGARSSLPGGPLRTSLDLAYREIGLGAYQPGDVDRDPLRLGWPAGIVGEARDCLGWDLTALEDPFR